MNFSWKQINSNVFLAQPTNTRKLKRIEKPGWSSKSQLLLHRKSQKAGELKGYERNDNRFVW